MNPTSTRPRLDPANIGVIDDEMVEVLRAKTPAEKFATIWDINDRARRLLTTAVRLLHPGCNDEANKAEVARNYLHETTESCRLFQMAAAQAEAERRPIAMRDRSKLQR